MLNLARVITFIAATDAARAREFYGTTLGLPLVSEELPYALVFDAGGIMLRVSILEEFQPAQFTVLGWEVQDIRAAVTSLRDSGIQFRRYPYFDQDELGIWTAPDSTKVAWFNDSEGNVLSLSEFATKE